MSDDVLTDRHTLDDVRIVHDLRSLLWREWGERTVPVLWIDNGVCGLKVRGTNETYVVTVTREP